MNYKNTILATGCNSTFFKSCQTLIASCHKHLPSLNEIRIYNLGLSNQEIDILNSYHLCNVHNIPSDIITSYPHIMELKTFAWKPYIIYDITHSTFENCIYIDSGACFVRNASVIYDILNSDEVILVGDCWKNYMFTHDTCFNIMQASENEKNGIHLWAGFQAYKANGTYQKLVDDVFWFSHNKSCIAGPISTHRHDQSIYSILAIRYNAPYQPLDIFGEYRHNTGKNQIVFTHRNTFFDISGIIKK